MIIFSRGSVQTAISIFVGGVTGILEKWVTSIRNVHLLEHCIFLVREALSKSACLSESFQRSCVNWETWKQLKQIPFLLVLLGILELLSFHVYTLQDYTLCVTVCLIFGQVSVSAQNWNLGQMYQPDVLSMGKRRFTERSMYVVPRNISTAKFLTTTNHLHTCRVPIFSIKAMIPCILLDILIAVRGLGARRRLIYLSRCSLR